MELKLIPHDKNLFPLKGLLIRGTSLHQWVHEIQQLDLPAAGLQIYPVPGTEANSLWGCLVVAAQDMPHEKTGRHQRCQALMPTVLIPERSTLSPMPYAAELDRLFPNGMYIIHPDFGWVELPPALQLHELMADPAVKPLVATTPAPTVRLPATIRSFQVQAQSPEAVMATLQGSFPDKKEIDDTPLSPWEKIRLGFYKMLLVPGKKESTRATGQSASGESLLDKIGRVLEKMLGSGKSWDRMMQDFSALEERNKKQIDRLVDMLRNDPEEALHYAIPLDDSNTTRGNAHAEMRLDRRQTDFSLFGKRAQGSGGSFNAGDHFQTLREQYYATAEELIRRREHHKAAFVYLNLLKDYTKAAETLEAGKYHQEAATIYLKFLHDKRKAAACYEAGNMTTEAIALYVQLDEHEKAGDLYTALANEAPAIAHYTLAMEDLKRRGKYLKAALISLNKMKNKPATQVLLVEGWTSRHDPVDCLNLYLSTIDEPGQRGKELQNLYRSAVPQNRREQFLHVVKHEFKKEDAEHDRLKELAYEIIAAEIPGNRAIVSELKDFSPENTELFKDTLRFKVNKT